MSFKSAISDEQALRVAISSSINRSQVLKLLNLTSTKSNYFTLKKFVDEYNICTKHFSSSIPGAVYKQRFLDEEVFVVNSTYPRHSLKNRIIKGKMIPYACSKCKNEGVWNGMKLTLQLEHINGISDDNRLINLCFLCPNCHTQTATYAGKNKI